MGDTPAVPILTETTTDIFGTFETRWMCEPPEKGVGFYAVEDEWNEDFSVRVIYKIRLGD